MDSKRESLGSGDEKRGQLSHRRGHLGNNPTAGTHMTGQGPPERAQSHMPLRHRLPGREIHRHIQRQPTQRETPRACRYKLAETEHTELDTQRCICLQTHSLQTRRGSVHISTITEHEYPDRTPLEIG